MVELFPEINKKIYKLYISYPDNSQDYTTFQNRMSKTDEAFKWEIINNITESDVLIVLSGLYIKDQERILNDINKAKTENKPIVVIRPYGQEDIPQELENKANEVIGWNTACIVDAILLSITNDSTNLPY
ncbi:MAG: TIR domain-containing protein [Methanobacteriaceae archaeon]|nr:TIR domain-containing protein [Methanobacteriaceae archaeon]